MNAAAAAAHAPLPEPAWGGLLAAYFVLIGLPSEFCRLFVGPRPVLPAL